MLANLIVVLQTVCMMNEHSRHCFVIDKYYSLFEVNTRVEVHVEVSNFLFMGFSKSLLLFHADINCLQSIYATDTQVVRCILGLVQVCLCLCGCIRIIVA